MKEAPGKMLLSLLLEWVINCQGDYSTVTLLARFLGWSTLQPLITAM